MARRLLTLVCICLAGGVTAQTPEVAIFADLRPTLRVETGQTNRIRWYDLQGNYSVIGFYMILETGNRVKVTQRLEKIVGGGDPDNLDEYYIESRGNWRIGKQYLPFGQQNILRETAPALRYDTQLLFDAVPMHIAVADNGKDLTRGVVARIGREVGASVAVGNNFGIQGSSLTQFHRPEDALGKGRGYRTVYGLDGAFPAWGNTVEGEWVYLRDGETDLDEDRNLTDVRFRFATPKTNYVITVAWSRSWNENRDIYRATAELPINAKVSWEPFIRFRGLDWKDFGLTARVRL